METDPMVGASCNVDRDPLQQQVQATVTGPTLVICPGIESNLPQPLYMMGSGQVMTDEQLETLRRQISVYSTICQQLVEMHKACVSAQSTVTGMVSGQHIAYDTSSGTLNHKATARQRWTPSQSQLQILEKLFDQGNGTPNKLRIKEITAELSHHGQIAETNVYNWFQNRKARAKRKQQLASTRDGESEVDTDNDSPKEKKSRFDKDSGQEYSNSGGRAETGGGQSSDGGGAYDQTRNIVDQYDQQEGDSSGLMLSQAESKEGGVHFGGAVTFEQGYAKGGSMEPSLSKILVNGKQLEVSSRVSEVKGSHGETAVLLDSHGQNVRTDEGGMTLQSRRAGESYRPTAGPVDGCGGPPSMTSEGIHAHNIQQMVRERTCNHAATNTKLEM